FPVTANKVPTFRFSPTSTQYALGLIKVPSNFEAGQRLKMKLLGFGLESATAHSLRFDITVSRLAFAPTASYSETFSYTLAGSGNAKLWHVFEPYLNDENGQVDSTDLSPGELLLIEISRDGDHLDDTYDHYFHIVRAIQGLEVEDAE